MGGGKVADSSIVNVKPANLPHSQLMATVKFKKPIPTKPEALTGYAPEFLQRLAEIEAKTHTQTLSSGRQICYFDESPTDANVGALPVVLCLHGFGQSKELWMEPEPVAYARLIALDRMGSGGSSLMPAPYGFRTAVAEIGELLDKIGIDKFFVMGHSAGGMWAMQVAAGLGAGDDSRVLGAAIVAAPCDAHHATAPRRGTKEWQKLGHGNIICRSCTESPGCLGSIVREVVVKRMFPSFLVPPKKKDQDMGFHSLYVDSERKSDGGCERTFEAMDKDAFFVSKNLYSCLIGCNDNTTPLAEFMIQFQRWDYDCADFKGHCVIYAGEKDSVGTVPISEQSKRAISQADFVIMEGHGHTTIMLEAPSIMRALVAREPAKQVY